MSMARYLCNSSTTSSRESAAQWALSGFLSSGRAKKRSPDFSCRKIKGNGMARNFLFWSVPSLAFLTTSARSVDTLGAPNSVHSKFSSPSKKPLTVSSWRTRFSSELSRLSKTAKTVTDLRNPVLWHARMLLGQKLSAKNTWTWRLILSVTRSSKFWAICRSLLLTRSRICQRWDRSSISRTFVAHACSVVACGLRTLKG